MEHIVPAYSLLPEGADTEAAEAAQPTQAAEAAPAAAQCTEAAAAAQSAAAEAAEEAAEEDAEAAAVYGLDPSGSASLRAACGAGLRLRESFIVRDKNGQALA